MKKLLARWSLLPVLGACLLWLLPAEPIVLGCPLSTAFLYGWDAKRSTKLTVSEISAAGGVKVGN